MITDGLPAISAQCVRAVRAGMHDGLAVVEQGLQGNERPDAVR